MYQWEHRPSASIIWEFTIKFLIFINEKKKSNFKKKVVIYQIFFSTSYLFTSFFVWGE